MEDKANGLDWSLLLPDTMLALLGILVGGVILGIITGLGLRLLGLPTPPSLEASPAAESPGADAPSGSAS